jgi:hypothetical protein
VAAATCSADRALAPAISRRHNARVTSKRALYSCTAGHEFVVQFETGVALQDGIKCGAAGCRARAKYGRVQYEPLGGWDDAPESATPYFFVKGRPYEIRGENRVMPQGRHFGVSDAAHAAKHRERQRRFANEHHAFRRGHSKKKADQPVYLGTMSGEMVRSIGIQEGDPSAVLKNPVDFLRKTGRLVGKP